MWTPFSPGKWQWPYRKHFPFGAESQAGIQLSQVAGLASLAFSTTAGTGIVFWLVGIDSEGGKWLVLTSGGWYASDYLPNLTSDDLRKSSLSLFFILPRECPSTTEERNLHLVSASCMPGGFPGSSGKESACQAGDSGSVPGSGRSPGEGHNNPLQYSCLENSTERGAWWATVHRVAKESDMT